MHFVHFSANTFLAPYLHQFSTVTQILQVFGAIWKKNYIKFGSNVASKFKKWMQKQHLLMVLFGTNLESNISTKVSNKHHI